MAPVLPLSKYSPQYHGALDYSMVRSIMQRYPALCSHFLIYLMLLLIMSLFSPLWELFLNYAVHFLNIQLFSHLLERSCMIHGVCVDVSKGYVVQSSKKNLGIIWSGIHSSTYFRCVRIMLMSSPFCYLLGAIWS